MSDKSGYDNTIDAFGHGLGVDSIQKDCPFTVAWSLEAGAIIFKMKSVALWLLMACKIYSNFNIKKLNCYMLIIRGCTR